MDRSRSRARSRRRRRASLSSYSPSSISTGTAETGITATPTSDSAAPANGSRSTDVTRPPSRLIASRRLRIDSAIVLPGPAHGETLESYPCQRRSSRGNRSRSASAPRWPSRCREIGHIGLVTVLVGDDPASEVYIRLKHKAALEAGFDAHDVRLPAETSEEDLLAKVVGTERGRRDRRDPRPAAAARPHRRSADPARDRSGEGRRRSAPVQRRTALPREADARRRDAGRRDGDAARAQRSRSTARAPS